MEANKHFEISLVIGVLIVSCREASQGSPLTTVMRAYLFLSAAEES